MGLEQRERARFVVIRLRRLWRDGLTFGVLGSTAARGRLYRVRSAIGKSVAVQDELETV